MSAGILIDENLPISIVPLLVGDQLQVIHVLNCGLEGTSDTLIWDYACQNDLVILTKDSDYFDLLALNTVGRVILMTVGNMRLALLKQFILDHREVIQTFSAGTFRAMTIG